MPAISGSFSGTVAMTTSLSVSDQANHGLSLVQVHGTQKTSDEKWNNVPVTYCGVTDLVGGQGTQTGYFVNDHGADGRDYGTFEGKVMTNGSETTVDGSWQYSGGTGKFKGITGKGTFKNRVRSASEVETTWQGAYEIGNTKKAHAR